MRCPFLIAGRERSGPVEKIGVSSTGRLHMLGTVEKVAVLSKEPIPFGTIGLPPNVRYLTIERSRTPMPDPTAPAAEDPTTLPLLQQFRRCAHLMRHTSSHGGGTRILVKLLLNGPVTQRALADLLERTPATLSQQLEPLERDGLVERAPPGVRPAHPGRAPHRSRCYRRPGGAATKPAGGRRAVRAPGRRRPPRPPAHPRHPRGLLAHPPHRP